MKWHQDIDSGRGQPEGNASLADEKLRISADSFERMADYVTQELGIRMPESKVSLIQSRLFRRVRELELGSLNEYCDYLFSKEGSVSEPEYFLNAITTNKTDFFREPQHFEYLTRVALPELVRSAYTSHAGGLSVWSAACSSGEEPYTLAMVLSEYAAGRPGFSFRILATDFSTKVLDQAKDGIYTRQQVEPVPPELRRKYLLYGRGNQHSLVRIKPALREAVSFHHLNFMAADYGVQEMFDIVFCRNVLIYFDRPTQQAVIAKLCRNLNPGGYLFISHSESLSGLKLPLDALGSSCFRRRKDI